MKFAAIYGQTIVIVLSVAFNTDIGYIDEWIQHHTLMGATQLIILDSTSILRGYVPPIETVTILEASIEGIDELVSQVIKSYSLDDSDAVFIELTISEFIVVNENNKLADLFATKCGASANLITLSTYVYGSSGHQLFDTQSTRQRFTTRSNVALKDSKIIFTAKQRTNSICSIEPDVVNVAYYVRSRDEFRLRFNAVTHGIVASEFQSFESCMAFVCRQFILATYDVLNIMCDSIQYHDRYNELSQLMSDLFIRYDINTIRMNEHDVVAVDYSNSAYIEYNEYSDDWFLRIFNPHKHIAVGPLVVTTTGIATVTEGDQEFEYEWTQTHSVTLYTYSNNNCDDNTKTRRYRLDPRVQETGCIDSIDSMQHTGVTRITLSDLYYSILEHYYFSGKILTMSAEDNVRNFIHAVYDTLLIHHPTVLTKSDINEDSLTLLSAKIHIKLTEYYLAECIPDDYDPFTIYASDDMHSTSRISSLFTEEPTYYDFSNQLVAIDVRTNDCFDVYTNMQSNNSSNSSFLFFIAYHNSHSYNMLNSHFNNITAASGILPVRIESTVYFEYILYRDYLTPSLLSELQSVSYIGVSSYKSFTLLVSCCGGAVRRYLEIAHHYDYDVVPLMRSKKSMLKSSVISHGAVFMLAWDALLLEMGYTLDRIRMHDGISPFYRNSMLIKPSWLRKLTEKMRQAIDITTHNATIRALFEVSAGTYRAVNTEDMDSDSSAVAERIFGTPYYQQFPFVFERLVSFFLIAEGATVCQHNDVCYYNTVH